MAMKSLLERWRRYWHRREPKMPMHPACASYGACGHCGARGGGECVLWR